MYKMLAEDVKICVMQMIKKRNIFLKEEKKKRLCHIVKVRCALQGNMVLEER